jgi:hypothetical protein
MEFMFWIVLVAMVLAPIPAAIGCFRLAKGIRHGWIAHVLFLPCLLGAEWLLLVILTRTFDDHGSRLPGVGLALAIPLTSFVLAVFGYYFSLAVTFFGRLTGSLRSASRRSASVPQ